MRVASLLPMLLLWLSSLGAQNNCNIFDLTATAVQIDPINCQFFVSLDFQHNGTTNQYSVTANGTNFGLFPYSQVPVVLGPFNNNPNAPTLLEFQVADAVIPDCGDAVQILVPPCGNPNPCDITNLNVLPGLCDPTGQTYTLWVNFQVQLLLGNSFDVWANNTLIGTFPLVGLPLQIPNFPASGNPTDVIKVCINGQPNCCEILEFDAPDCVNPPCNIVDLTVQTGDCTSDSTYKITVDFDLIGQVGQDSFAVWSNGTFVGLYGVNQLPLMLDVAWSGGQNDEIKVCIANTNIVCCKTRAYPAPNCLFLPPCAIQDLVVKSDTCTSDSTFHAIVNFTVNDPTAVDSFDLWANGDFWGSFGMNQLPLHIDSFPWNGLIFNTIRVCTSDLPNDHCCKEYQFIAPACLPFGPCEVTDISVLTGACTSDSTYKLTLNFNGTNPGNGTFTVSIHNQLIDTFNLTQVPLMLEVPWNGQLSDSIMICILGADSVPGNIGCCKVKQFQVPTCLLPCNIFDVTIDPGACNPTDNSYALHLDFEVLNPGNDSFQVWGNGIYLGLYPLNALPLLIPNFPSNGTAVDVLKICINNNPDCCETIDFQGPDCTPCNIPNLMVEPGDCNTGSNTYSLTVKFDVINPGSDSFQVWGNGTYLGLFPLAGLPLTIPNFPANGAAFDVIKVCIQNQPDCCAAFEFQGPDCNQNCDIFDLVVDPGACNPNSNTYALGINFQVSNPGSDSFQVWGNGNYLGLFPLAGLPLVIPDFPSNGAAFDVLKICINNQPNCCETIDFQGPDCNQNCEIFGVVLDPGACTSDSTYNLVLNFQVQNPGSDSFQVWGNGIYLGSYPLAGLPLVIPNFPSNGGAIDIIKICINNHPDCCKTIDFQGPNCNPNCEIFGVVLDPGACTSDSTYNLHLNFQVQNPGSDSFQVWGNGIYLGVYPLTGLPLVIPNFPSNGAAFDVIKICINNNPDCCKTIDFQGPDCSIPCEIFNVVVDPGNCNPIGNSYSLVLDFDVQNPGNALFEVWGNGIYLGLFPLNALPLTIPNFPANGNAPDGIKICINDHPDCCVSFNFPGPDCNNLPCEIFNLTVQTGACNVPDSTYAVTVNFQVQNPGSNNFALWANGQFLGMYNLGQLPLTIPNFPWDGAGPNDLLKVCMTVNSGALTCCQTIEFPTPDCFNNNNCDIFDLAVQTGACTSDSTYQLWVNFQVNNPPGNLFTLWANGQFFGIFDVNDLPLAIPNFPWNGGLADHIKVCFTNAPGGPASCCAEIEFLVPGCLFNNDCDIYDLTVTPGGCDPNAPTYPLTFDFEVDNPGNTLFEVWVNGTYYGAHPLTALPFTIPGVPSNGTAPDEIKVCINDHPNCCQTLVFPGPDCNQGGNCEIFNVVLDPGDCDPATDSYELHLNFQVINPGNDSFEVWGNGAYLGMFPLANLPIVLPNFPSNGAAFDVIKICIKNHPDCCKELQFQGPNCGGGGNCEIFDLVLETGQCTSDSTYQLKINFQVINPPSDFFQVWANGQPFGIFNLNQLPLLVQNFPWNGGNFDGIKICMVGNVPGIAPCCIEKEFPVPDCLLNDDCHIWDLMVVKTPCLCGQFFAVLTFEHSNGGAGGFDIVGNGNNYGNFPYNTPQPIILGPFNGDGTTMYEFAVIDHDQPNLCGDAFNLGKVECMTPANDPTGGSAMLTMSPNPTANWLNVTALLENGASIGQANVEVYAADGRLVHTIVVANGGNFQLDVANLPSGIYRLVLKSDSGRLEGTFAKE